MQELLSVKLTLNARIVRRVNFTGHKESQLIYLYKKQV